VLVSFGILPQSAGLTNDDVSVFQSILDRLISLPLESLRALEEVGGPLTFLTGAGFGMADTALVPAAYSLGPMAHNQFVELYLVFGLPGLGLGLYMFFIIGTRLFRLSKEGKQFSKATLLGFLCFITNGVFANGILYQPTMALMFYFFIFYACYFSVLSEFSHGPRKVIRGES
jgi:hypothetical protein